MVSGCFASELALFLLIMGGSHKQRYDDKIDSD
jgi:hypothetical protein